MPSAPQGGARPAKPAGQESVHGGTAHPAPQLAGAATVSTGTKPMLVAGQEVRVPAGRLLAGSPTGSSDRDPSREADAIALELPEFQMDVLPFPNDPSQPPRASLERGEAEALCAKQGKRLCSELEWERACKGDENRPYPGEPFDLASCTKEASACRAPFGTFAMGTLGREWTASDVRASFDDKLRTAITRGASPDAPKAAHRCAARDAATPDSKRPDLFFRCCRGPIPPLTYPSEARSEQAFPERELDAKQLQGWLSSMPETQIDASGFKPFRADEIKKHIEATGRGRPPMAPWVASTKPLLWSPVPGEQLWVVAGDTPRGAMLIAFYPLGEARALLAASYLTRDEHAPIVIAYKADVPKQVLFSTCWGCGGEGGALELGSDARVHVVQR